MKPRRRVLPENQTRLPLVKKFPVFCGNRRFITLFTTARHLSLSYARSIQYKPLQRISFKIHSNIILPPTHVFLVAPFPHFLHQNPVFTSPLLLTSHMPLPSHSSWFAYPSNLWWQVRIIKLHTVQFSPIPRYLFPLWPNIYLSTSL